jgi:hypothetical protein
VTCNVISIKVVGAPLACSPPDGPITSAPPIHKRAPITLEGFFVGAQWPAALVRRKTDGKILSVARQKIRIDESQYTANLDVKIDPSSYKPATISTTENESSAVEESKMRPPVDRNMVQSIKSLREHRQRLPGADP